jgi:hypothetical protein
LTSFTSQNHQYALKLQDPFPEGWEPFFINCNDSSVEGIKSTTESGKNVWGIQFHPESAGGPLDTIEVGSLPFSISSMVDDLSRCSMTLLRSVELTRYCRVHEMLMLLILGSLSGKHLSNPSPLQPSIHHI